MQRQKEGDLFRPRQHGMHAHIVQRCMNNTILAAAGLDKQADHMHGDAVLPLRSLRWCDAEPNVGAVHQKAVSVIV